MREVYIINNVLRISFFVSFCFEFVFIVYVLLTKTTAARNGVALSYHRVRGLYFLAVVFVRSIIICNNICACACTCICACTCMCACIMYMYIVCIVYVCI